MYLFHPFQALPRLIATAFGHEDAIGLQIAAADAAHLVCLVWANTGTQGEARGAKTAGVTERKLAEVYDLVKDGKMSGDAAREYIFGKT